MKIETIKNSICTYILVKQYISEDFNQLIALINSYNYMYPWYQSITENKNDYIIMNFGVFLNKPELDFFNHSEWRYKEIKDIK